jgi:hypothetical protein
MEEAVELDSGFEDLAAFALQSVIALNKELQTSGGQNKRVNTLQIALEELSGFLEGLTQTAGTTAYDLSALNRPLWQCGRACENIKESVMTSSSKSGSGLISVSDLRYMGDGIDALIRLLTNYSETIEIVLEESSM